MFQVFIYSYFSLPYRFPSSTSVYMFQLDTDWLVSMKKFTDIFEFLIGDKF